jgi:hypothetical protein
MEKTETAFDRNENIKVSGFTFFLLAIIAFAGMCAEIILEYPFITIAGVANYDLLNGLQKTIFTMVTCLAWGVVAMILIKIANGKYRLNLFEKTEKMKIWQWFTAIFIAVFTIAFFHLVTGNFRVVLEFSYLYKEYGLLRIISQLIYYFFEIVLVVLIIIFAQRAGEIWFKKKNFPWGGILLGLTWGLIHIYTQDLAVGIVAVFLGILYGIIYLLVNRDIKKTIAISLLMLFI